MAYVDCPCYDQLVPTTASQIDWVVFATGVLGTMILDRLLWRRARAGLTFRQALVRSVLWLTVGLALAVWIAY